ncbi:hypothetical protein EYF80_038784 [Liparis tanakae]|uniref:Uncharacterized protein n=1 Tax=Liparis tanakae TaxID=230148 RepID=A0A4Z2GE81_9TELE|nr:hypothetical protein EYF80_038784 [Liparis tanakae]
MNDNCDALEEPTGLVMFFDKVVTCSHISELHSADIHYSSEGTSVPRWRLLPAERIPENGTSGDANHEDGGNKKRVSGARDELRGGGGVFQTLSGRQTTPTVQVV